VTHRSLPVAARAYVEDDHVAHDSTVVMSRGARADTARIGRPR